MLTTKQCSVCKEHKPLSEFNPNGKGLYSQCKTCKNEKHRQRRVDRLQKRIHRGTHRARTKGRKVDHFTSTALRETLKLRGLKELECAFTGEMLTYEKNLPNTQNLDHLIPLVDPSSSHSQYNVVPTSQRFNSFKRNTPFPVAIAEWWDYTAWPEDERDRHCPKALPQRLLSAVWIPASDLYSYSLLKK